MRFRRIHIIVLLGAGLLCVGLLLFVVADLDSRRLLDERIVYQTSPIGCASASLTMVLQSIGVACTLDTVQSMFRFVDAGASVAEIQRVAGLFGVRSTARRIDRLTIAGTPTPCIVFIDNDHFAVLDSVREERVFLRDPARGAQHIAMNAFLGRWNGIVVEFKRKKTPS